MEWSVIASQSADWRGNPFPSFPYGRMISAPTKGSDPAPRRGGLWPPAGDCQSRGDGTRQDGGREPGKPGLYGAVSGGVRRGGHLAARREPVGVGKRDAAGRGRPALRGTGNELPRQSADWRAMTTHSTKPSAKYGCGSNVAAGAIGFPPSFNAPTPSDAGAHPYPPPCKAQPVEGPQVSTAPTPAAPHPPTCTPAVQVGSLKRFFSYTVHGAFSF